MGTPEDNPINWEEDWGNYVLAALDSQKYWGHKQFHLGTISRQEWALAYEYADTNHDRELDHGEFFSYFGTAGAKLKQGELENVRTDKNGKLHPSAFFDDDDTWDKTKDASSGVEVSNTDWWTVFTSMDGGPGGDRSIVAGEWNNYLFPGWNTDPMFTKDGASHAGRVFFIDGAYHAGF